MQVRTFGVLVALAVLAACSSGTAREAASSGSTSSVSSTTSSSSVAEPPPHVTATVAVAPGPTALASGFGAVWVTAHHAAQLQRIDAKAATLAASVPVGFSPGSVTVGPDAVWALDYGDGKGWRVDPTTGAATSFAAVDGEACGLIAANAAAVWASDCTADVVVELDPSTFERRRTLPHAGDLVLASGYLWVSTFEPNRLFRVDLASGAEEEIDGMTFEPGGEGPEGLWVSKAAAGSDPATVALIDPTTLAVLRSFPAAGTPLLDGGVIWLVDNDGVVSRADAATGTVVPWTDLRTPGNADGQVLADGALWVSDFHHDVVRRVELSG